VNDKTEGRKAARETTEDVPVGLRRVGPLGIVAVCAYLVLLTVTVFYGLLQFWPRGAEGGASTAVRFLAWEVDASGDVRLLVIVILAGALGSLVHALRSIYWYVGNRELRWSWTAMYALLPFVGAALATVFYFVFRGGLFSSEAAQGAANVYGFAAVAGLVGLFTQQAVLKLKAVAETLLARPTAGVDSKPQGVEEADEKDEG
jgi:hypothetical protein